MVDLGFSLSTNLGCRPPPPAPPHLLSHYIIPHFLSFLIYEKRTSQELSHGVGLGTQRTNVCGVSKQFFMRGKHSEMQLDLVMTVG